MSLQDIRRRLVPLAESLKQTQSLIQQLSKLSSQSAESANTPEQGDGRAELSSEIQEALKSQEDEFELLRQEAEDQTKRPTWSHGASSRIFGNADDRVTLATQITKLGEDLRLSHIQFRRAQLTAKRNAEASRRKERELLFEGFQEGDGATTGNARRKGQEKLSHEDLLLGASNDVTAALRRTHALMSAELQRSRFARETLENSTKDLNSLSETYTNLDTLLSSSRTLVSTLIHSQKSDTWYLESAFIILSITIGWLVFRRILYGPGWWFIYFPVRLIWRTLLLTIQLLSGSLSILFSSTTRNKLLNSTVESVQTGSSLIVSSTTETDTLRMTPAMSHASPATSTSASDKAPDQSGNADTLLSEQVGAIVDATQGKLESSTEPSKGTVLRDRGADEPPNPKKRMWEEPVDGQQTTQGTHRKDEL